ncbi:hypothetical protein Nepgr_017296 [Nepenthes gracilis]|uniref:Uncharacterized protein n=1 Tax=Nepenthes gracilis TaxID=150966 RepID=A0AAD3SP69_NEPGR|nr:hypothetical protein Nepgr_017296 [Nepenthes gracilis]
MHHPFEGDHCTGKRKSETSEIGRPTKKNKLDTSEKATHPYNLRSLSKKNNPAPAMAADAKATAATAKQPGVRQRKSGKWTAEIGNPFETGKKIKSFKESANALMIRN